MRRFKLLSLCCLILLSGCATIFSNGGYYKLSINSSPSNARYIILDENNKMVSKGVTPDNVSLQAGEAYFKKKSYIIQYNLEGYYPKNVVVKSEINPFYWGNCCVGGLLGLFIVDPITGAVYQLQNNKAFASLEQRSVMISNLGDEMKVEKDTLQKKTTILNDSVQKPVISAPAKPKKIEDFDYYPPTIKKDTLH
jgi:hypothetical protein